MNALAELVSSRVRAEVFRLLFGLDRGELHMREVERQSGLAYGTVRQELASLARLGLVEARKSGNRTYYHANTAHPLYTDIRSIVLKTSGLTDLLRRRLSHPGIQIAFVFGSMASAREKPRSDLDLMVIGTIGLRQLGKLLSGAAKELGREVNPHVLTVEEFLSRKRARDHFLTTVLSEPKLFVIGSESELETMGERRLAASALQQPARGR
jgi:DNA-binding transcriptional ArsR family regulator